MQVTSSWWFTCLSIEGHLLTNMDIHAERASGTVVPVILALTTRWLTLASCEGNDLWADSELLRGLKFVLLHDHFEVIFAFVFFWIVYQIQCGWSNSLSANL